MKEDIDLFTKEGKALIFSLIENDITLSSSVELSNNQWLYFVNLLDKGSVTIRERNIKSGDSGPWLYLY